MTRTDGFELIFSFRDDKRIWMAKEMIDMSIIGTPQFRRKEIQKKEEQQKQDDFFESRKAKSNYESVKGKDSFKSVIYMMALDRGESRRSCESGRP